jgi:hypothetical protein
MSIVELAELVADACENSPRGATADLVVSFIYDHDDGELAPEGLCHYEAAIRALAEIALRPSHPGAGR